MAIVSLQNVSKHYGQQVVLEDVSVQIEDDDKIGLIGANGTGKSTLLRIIAGEVVPDGGIVNRRKMLTVSTVHQDPDLSAHTTLYDYAKSAFDDLQQIQREMQSTEADLHATPNGAEHDAIGPDVRQHPFQTALAVVVFIYGGAYIHSLCWYCQRLQSLLYRKNHTEKHSGDRHHY